MNTAKAQFEKTWVLNPNQEQFLKEHSNCAICETKLEIHHEINMKDSMVKEEAYCSCCGIRARMSSYKLN
jgi:hypothetical protein